MDWIGTHPEPFKIMIIIDQTRDRCHRIIMILFWETEQLEQGLGKTRSLDTF